VSRACVQTGRQATGERTADATGQPSVALVVGEGSRDRLDGLLTGQGLNATSFDTVEELLEQGPGPLSMAVLWTERKIARALSNLEPLRQELGEAPIVMICPDEIRGWELRAALAAGATGVVLESEMEHALGPCLQAALAGQICVPGRHWQQIEPPSLSSREKQILGLVVMGHSNGQIAEQLFLAESTVKSHLSSSFNKLGVRSRNEAVDLILDSERGLGMGILALGGEPVEPTLSAAE
jgi:DNA-binding NarL/FixJ family response regulator